MSAAWKQLPTTSVIDNVHDVVRVQYADVRRALYGHGNYTAAPAFNRHQVRYHVWQAADEDRKTCLFRRFLRENGRRPAAEFVTSADGVTKTCTAPHSQETWGAFSSEIYPRVGSTEKVTCRLLCKQTSATRN